MSTGEIVGMTLGAICFVIWIPCMVSWVRRGVVIPRYVHLLAALLTCLGLGALVGLTAVGMVTLKLAIILVPMPPLFAYFGWFWLFGPDLPR